MQTFFKESPVYGYVERTITNASADATIAFALDFNSPGEKLTKKSVLCQNKIYIPVDVNDLKITNYIIDIIIEILNKKSFPEGIDLNIAGNGLHTIKGKLTQEQCDDFTYKLLKNVIHNPKLENKINLIRSGGQTGFDESGIKAGIKLNIPTLVYAPKGWLYRTQNGVDISNEKKFKKRFMKELNISYKCLLCDIEIKKILEADDSKPWDGAFEGGIVESISAGYGSDLDGDNYIIAICDKCVEEKHKQGKLKYINNQFFPDLKK